MASQDSCAGKTSFKAASVQLEYALLCTRENDASSKTYWPCCCGPPIGIPIPTLYGAYPPICGPLLPSTCGGPPPPCCIGMPPIGMGIIICCPPPCIWAICICCIMLGFIGTYMNCCCCCICGFGAPICPSMPCIPCGIICCIPCDGGYGPGPWF